MRSKHKIVLGNVLNPVNDKKAQWIRGGALWLQLKGDRYVIHKIGKVKTIERLTKSLRSVEVLNFADQVIIPGLFDLHFHWVQDDVCEMPKDSLISWLENHTWPAEKAFEKKIYAKTKAREFSEKLRRVGTLGGASYGSVHGQTVDLALENFTGDFVVGNVLMTMNSPEYLLQNKQAAIDLVKKKIHKFKKSYAVTPRFAPTTHPDVMRATSKLAHQYSSFIQSHLCETKQEIEWVLEIFRAFPGLEDVESYTEVYERCGVLGPKTIMGHGIYLSPEEIRSLKKSRTSLAHCPTSNAPIDQKGLGSGLFDYQVIEQANIPWGLGSDIGAGPFLSMFDVMNSFVLQNRKEKRYGATYTKALFRATKANAIILQLENVGDFAVGKDANFLVLDGPSEKSAEGPESILKNIHERARERGDFDNRVRHTYYQGEKVYTQS